MKRIAIVMAVCWMMSSAAEAAPLFLHASGKNIVDSNGAIVHLRGVNLGAWLFMETWMSGGNNDLADDLLTISKLDGRFGVATEQSLVHAYRASWLTTTDLDNIAAMHFNVVRVPVWWGDFATYDPSSPTDGVGTWRPDAYDWLDWLVSNCAARGIYVVIDMHGAVGGTQTYGVNPVTGHATTLGVFQNNYWTSGADQGVTSWMWWELADHFKNNPTVAGYDLINEPQGAPSVADSISRYNDLYGTVRSADADHMIFIEDTIQNTWNLQQLQSAQTLGWTNVVYEVHSYTSGTDAQVVAGAAALLADIASHPTYNVPIYVGEFNDYGCSQTCQETLVELYNTAGLGWSKWSYKALTGAHWGVYACTPATPPNLDMDSASTILSAWTNLATSASCARDTAVVLPVAPTGDLLFRSSTGAFVWSENSYGGTTTLTYPTPGFTYQGAGNFSGAAANLAQRVGTFGHNDVVWRDLSSGDVFLWRTTGASGSSITTSTTTYSASSLSVAPPWALQGIGDFDGDGNSDLLWYNTTTRDVKIWLMNGATIASTTTAFTGTPHAQIKGVGDFNGDGKSDLLWRSLLDGSLSVWTMSGGVHVSSVALPAPPSGSQVVGVGDFNADRTSDIVLSTGSSTLAIWWLTPGAGTISVTNASASGFGTSSTFKAVGDANGDGISDVFFQNPTTNEITVWKMAVVGGTQNAFTAASLGFVASGTTLLGASNLL